MIYMLNAFSLNMLPNDMEASLKYVPITKSEVRKTLLINGDYVCAIGHNDIANILSNMLDLNIRYNRQAVSLREGDIAIVAQYTGPRLQEGTTSLPQNATIRFCRVNVYNVRKTKDSGE